MQSWQEVGVIITNNEGNITALICLTILHLLSSLFRRIQDIFQEKEAKLVEPKYSFWKYQVGIFKGNLGAASNWLPQL